MSTTCNFVSNAWQRELKFHRLLALILGLQLLWYDQPSIFYPAAFLPRPRTSSTPKKIGVDYPDLELRTSDGVVLRCYLLRHTEQSDAPLRQGTALTTVIMFHGNGMNCGDGSWAASLLAMRRCNVLMLSYRGYGLSEGIPSEEGPRLDAQVALDYVKADPELSMAPTVLYGTSLGGAVAIDLASRNPSAVSRLAVRRLICATTAPTRINALMVGNTFESFPRVVYNIPVVGNISFLCAHKWDSASKVPRIPPTTPILMPSGSLDKVVPKKHMETLWMIAQGRGGSEPALHKDRFEVFPSGYHSTTLTCQGYWDKVGQLRSLAPLER
ncbi:Alpha/Beta hydrolase protein [Mycena epipterygia]|nr:Alpha/Beta hydrolase protein [Mycena epipterygia]